MRGLDLDAATAFVGVLVYNATTTAINAGIGLDSTTTFAADSVSGGIANANYTAAVGYYCGFP